MKASANDTPLLSGMFSHSRDAERSLIEVDPADTAWARFVSDHQAATAFHHPAWAKLVADCYGYHASALVLSKSDGEIEAGLPMLRVRRPLTGEQGISLPFTDQCTPLAKNEEALVQLSNAVARWSEGSTRAAHIAVHIRAAMPEV